MIPLPKTIIKRILQENLNLVEKLFHPYFYGQETIIEKLSELFVKWSLVSKEWKDIVLRLYITSLIPIGISNQSFNDFLKRFSNLGFDNLNLLSYVGKLNADSKYCQEFGNSLKNLIFNVDDSVDDLARILDACNVEEIELTLSFFESNPIYQRSFNFEGLKRLTVTGNFKDSTKLFLQNHVDALVELREATFFQNDLKDLSFLPKWTNLHSISLTGSKKSQNLARSDLKLLFGQVPSIELDYPVDSGELFSEIETSKVVRSFRCVVKDISDPGACVLAIAKLLNNNSTLTRLSISSYLAEEDMAAISLPFEILNHTLKYLELSRAPFFKLLENWGSCSALDHFSERMNFQLLHLPQISKIFPNLKDIKIIYNTEESHKNIVKCFEQCTFKKIQVFISESFLKHSIDWRLMNGHLVSLNVHQFTLDELVCFLDCNHPTIRELTGSINEILSSFASHLANNRTLTRFKMDLPINPIKYSSVVETVTSILKTNRSLTSLVIPMVFADHDLPENKFSHFKEAIQDNDLLELVLFSGVVKTSALSLYLNHRDIKYY